MKDCPICKGRLVEPPNNGICMMVLDGNHVYVCSNDKNHTFQRNMRHPWNKLWHNPQASDTNMNFKCDEYTWNEAGWTKEAYVKLRTLQEMSEEELFHIVNLTTGGYFNSKFSKEQIEVECGGHGNRRRVVWIMNTEDHDEYHFFEITSETKQCSWRWNCGSTFEKPEHFKGSWYKTYIIHSQNVAKIVDYCDEVGLDVRNTLR